MNKHRISKNIQLLFSYGFLIAMVIVILFPLFVTVMSAFNVSNSLYSATLIPERFDWVHNFKELFRTTEYLSWYRNTFFIAIVVMIISTTIITISGFIYSRKRYKTRKGSLMTLLLIQIIPSGSALIALYAIASSLGIYNSSNSTQLTYLYMILIYVAGTTTMNTIIMKGYYDSIPRDLDESARIDGATQWQVFRQILIPLVKPMIAVTALFCFLGPIQDVIMPKFLINSLASADTTLALGLQDLITDPTNSKFNLFAAGAILAAIPPVILFYKLQKHIVSGLASGGVKG